VTASPVMTVTASNRMVAPSRFGIPRHGVLWKAAALGTAARDDGVRDTATPSGSRTEGNEWVQRTDAAGRSDRCARRAHAPVWW
jgi:hypothetical protein